jgi:alkyl sulfatase BDS1-like metallo-beta-lactamase superfamily hydrolase
MPISEFFKTLSIRINGPNAASAGDAKINIKFTDRKPWLVMLRNGVLHSFEDKQADDAACTLKIAAMDFKQLLLGGGGNAGDLMKDGKLFFEGDVGALASLFGNMDKFDPLFPIVTPRPRM